MRMNPVLTFEQAMAFLYQPQNDYVNSIRLDEVCEITHKCWEEESALVAN
jgi:hypothetical protein